MAGRRKKKKKRDWSREKGNKKCVYLGGSQGTLFYRSRIWILLRDEKFSVYPTRNDNLMDFIPCGARESRQMPRISIKTSTFLLR